MKHFLTVCGLSFALSCTFFACSDGNNSNNKKTDSTGVNDTDKTKAAVTAPVEKAPIINIADTISPARLILYIKDSAKTEERIGPKLGEIYSVKLADVIKKNKLTMTGAPVAWYKSQKAPFFFEAGVPVNKMPSKLPANVFVKDMKADSALVAHFYGPYNQSYKAYNAIKDWAKENRIKIGGMPFEVYVGDPMEKDGVTMKDPYKVQTDIVFTRN